ncbi:uncharacterized protein HD556DRAFT_415802 [Suillus plorans]|uniref:Uncharacterized protein n=1 Tax=Suillus plorans TaxID=116603 RepID=A0A9P7DI74_9AGAM|nr:uncharacterized protein HD556DRAFT_415802 [Suillus plorans]KAG1794581.1 hypothetical protein HD556DRAFT_415802 [Suillus plorans]
MDVLSEGYYFPLTGLGIILVIVSETFFILRTYVLWNRNRILLATMVCTSFIFIVISFGVTFDSTTTYATSTIPGITGCSRSSTSYQSFVPFLLLSVFQMGLMILTLIRAVQNWRINSSRMYAVLVSHNISYYACGFVLSLTNILISLLLQDPPYQIVLYDFQFIILVILATRMHLHLWEVNRHPHDTTSTLVPMSDMSFANDVVPLTEHSV